MNHVVPVLTMRSCRLLAAGPSVLDPLQMYLWPARALAATCCTITSRGPCNDDSTRAGFLQLESNCVRPARR